MRRNAAGELSSTATKKRLAKPSRVTVFSVPRPTRRRPPAIASSATGELLEERRGGIVERHRPVRRAIDELADERVARRAHDVRRALGDDAAVGHEVDVVDDLERFV